MLLCINRAKSRTFPRADISSDHDLVMMTVKLKQKQNLRSHDSRLKFNPEKLKDREVADLFETTIGSTFAHLTCWKKTDNLTENIDGALVNTASEVLGKDRKKKKKKPGMANDILDLRNRSGSLKRNDKKALWQCINTVKSIK